MVLSPNDQQRWSQPNLGRYGTLKIRLKFKLLWNGPVPKLYPTYLSNKMTTTSKLSLTKKPSKYSVEFL